MKAGTRLKAQHAKRTSPNAVGSLGKHMQQGGDVHQETAMALGATMAQRSDGTQADVSTNLRKMRTLMGQ